MNERFKKLTERMPILLNELKATPLLNRNELEDIPKSGIYVFGEYPLRSRKGFSLKAPSLVS